MTMAIFLASRSERRQQLLKQLGIEFSMLDIEIDEQCPLTETPRDYVVRMAQEKAAKGKLAVGQNDIVIAADTSVVLDNHVLGKAETKQQAYDMLSQISGRRHDVMTAVCLLGQIETTMLNHSTVCFKPLSQKEIEEYIETGEPLGKAGGYAIQGIAARFIERLEGSYSAVMGLPLFETSELLNKHAG